MRLAVCIPWRPTPDRLRAFHYVCDWYRRHLPDAPLVTADSHHEPFSRAASRNRAVELAAAVGADTVVMVDADTVPDLNALRAAIGAASDGALHFALDKMAYLDEAQTEALYRGETIDVEGSGHDSSAYVIRVDSWRSIGGQDERFTGYGGEDGALTMAATELIGVGWHAGTALSLYHDPSVRDVGSERWLRDTAPLYRRYLDARGNPDAMRALIAERETK